VEPVEREGALDRFATYVKSVRESETELTQKALAARMKCSERTVLDMENGKHLPQRQRMHAWERALGPHPKAWELYREAEQERDLNRFIDREFGTVSKPPRRSVSVTPIREPGLVLEEADDVRRDSFLTFIGAGIAGLLAPPRVHDWPERRTPSTPELTDVLLTQARAQTEGFRWLDRREGAAACLPASARHARALLSAWRAAKPTHPLRPALGEAAADACHLVAYQAYDQGQRSAAAGWYDCASQLAERAGNMDLYVFSTCGVAYMHAKNGSPALALGILTDVEALQLSTVAHCYVAVYQAHALAAAGRQGLAEKALDRALAFASRANDEQPSRWLGVPDLMFVMRQQAMILARFGDAAALPVLVELDRSTPAIFQRYRVTLSTDQALTHAQAGDVEASAERLIVACKLNQSIRSAEKARQAMAVRGQLQTAASSRAVRTADEAMAAFGVMEIAAGATNVQLPPVAP
jgi:transcriptional regulator with XRE-family HTH domain